jgi:cytochrome P450/tellurite resistance protein
MKRTDLINAMTELGIGKDNHRAVALLPLVYVAWADGTVQSSERALILRIAGEKGWVGADGSALLERWLTQAPSAEHVELGLKVLRAMADQERGAGSSLTTHGLKGLLKLCRDVASAAGGYLGFADPISAEEAQALERIAGALALDESKTWDQLVAEEEAHEHPQPPGPKGHLLFGVAQQFSEDPLGMMTRAMLEHGDVVSLPLPFAKLLLLSKPEHVQHVFVDNPGLYQRGVQFEPVKLATGDALFTTEGDFWRRQRRIAQPAFHNKKIHAFGETIATLTAGMLDRWDAQADTGKPLEIADEMMRITLRVIGKLMCNLDLADEATELGEAISVGLEYINNYGNKLFPLPPSIPTPENRRFNDALARIDRVLFDIIGKRRAGTESQPDLLQMWMDATDEETGQKMNDQELRNELITMLVAGHETTAIALSWTLYSLSKHPAEARKLREEVVRVVGEARPSADHYAKLEYLEMVANESMRLFPPIWLNGRSAIAEDEIDGYVIPKDAMVICSPWVLHRHPKVWENPEGFDPSRFAADASSRHSLAFWPFGAGPHKCIGQSLAWMELKLILASIMQRFRLDLVPGFVPGYQPQLTLRPKNGMWMTIHRQPKNSG